MKNKLTDSNIKYFTIEIFNHYNCGIYSNYFAVPYYKHISYLRGVTIGSLSRYGFRYNIDYTNEDVKIIVKNLCSVRHTTLVNQIRAVAL